MGKGAGAANVQGTARNVDIARGIIPGGVAELQRSFRRGDPAVVRSREDEGSGAGPDQADRIGNRPGEGVQTIFLDCLLYTSPSPRDTR